ncbi:MAG: hypothetical protein LC791_05055 [Acidobacteria bacterium]|nr:hypothetical protein [Acidobacteriota bacterium]
MTHRPRIGVACPAPGERAALAEWLDAGGFEPVGMFNEVSISRELDAEAFEVLIVDEALVASGAVSQAMRARGTRRPLIIISNPPDASPKRKTSLHAMTMTRPVAHEDLLLAVSLALAEGRPARRSPRLQVPLLSSTIDGVASQLVDVSAEGLRLELSEQHRGSVPPFFTVRVPAFNVVIIAKRVWVARAATASSGRVWCGATLASGAEYAGGAWRALLEMAPVAALPTRTARLF